MIACAEMGAGQTPIEANYRFSLVNGDSHLVRLHILLADLVEAGTWITYLPGVDISNNLFTIVFLCKTCTWLRRNVATMDCPLP
jgi:hypothetical protein